MSALSAALEPVIEHRARFPCFGSECTVIVSDGARPNDARAAVLEAKRRLLEWHHRFSRFEPASELSELNASTEATVAVSPLLRRIVEEAVRAAAITDGLVDPTLIEQIEQAGYASHFEGRGVGLRRLLELAPPRAPAGARARASWRAVEVDRRTGSVTRPHGVKLDPGGIAKGVFADELASRLRGYGAFVVNCAGDMRIGGDARRPRLVHVASPFDDSTLHTFELTRGAVATSGIGKRSWLAPDGSPAHHLLDPATGEPAFTGVVQVTALAPSASEAEVLSKAAILSGPGRARRWLSHGGVVVLEDGRAELVSA